MASNNINVGSAANDGEGQTLRAAMISVRKNFAQMFGITYTSDTQDLSGTTFSSDVITQGSTNKFLTNGSVIAARLASNAVTTIKILDANITTAKILDANVTTAKIADNAVDAAKLNVSGNGTSGQVLASDGDGSMTWTTSSSGYSAIYASSAITSWTDKAVYVFTNTAALTHTLPSSPSVGTSFKMSLRSTHVNTLARNGSSIMGLAEDLVLDDLTSSFEFFFAGGAQGWVIIGAN